MPSSPSRATAPRARRASTSTVPWNNVLTFFEDDFTTGGWEAPAGTVDRIAVYDCALTDAQVEGTDVSDGVPTVTVVQASVQVAEGQTASNSGTWAHSCGDPVT